MDAEQRGTLDEWIRYIQRGHRCSGPVCWSCKRLRRIERAINTSPVPAVEKDNDTMGVEKDDDTLRETLSADERANDVIADSGCPV